ncbi:MAG: glycerophosphodiester phosphodiesterase family protein, partial [Vicinamibacterales bacterium]
MTARNRPRQTVIGHRGASAYAPEHTLAAYELAIRQGADAVEQDLHVTRDGALVCLHDRTLERTTDVRERFRDRGRDTVEDGRPVRHWLVHDFDLAEIKQLDAGRWFGTAFAGARIPTFHEVLEWVGDRATLLVELKDPEVYETLGVDLLALVDAAVRRHPVARARTGEPLVTLQSFHEPTMRRARTVCDRTVPLVLLMEPADAHRWPDGASLEDVARFASGIGPGRPLVEARPELVRWAHDLGLRVTPWTFRAREHGRLASIEDELTYNISVLGVDGVITDNPQIALSRR